MIRYDVSFFFGGLFSGIAPVLSSNRPAPLVMPKQLGYAEATRVCLSIALQIINIFRRRPASGLCLGDRREENMAEETSAGTCTAVAVLIRMAGDYAVRLHTAVEVGVNDGGRPRARQGRRRRQSPGAAGRCGGGPVVWRRARQRDDGLSVPPLIDDRAVGCFSPCRVGERRPIGVFA